MYSLVKNVLKHADNPKIGYKSRIEIMNPMIRGLVGEKMSSSVENTKIDKYSPNKPYPNFDL